MSRPDAEKWDAKHRAGDHDRSIPARVLSEYSHLLPVTGRALDLACGTGANAMFLARRGLNTSAWDFSEQAITVVQERAAKYNLTVQTRVCDVTAVHLPGRTFDVIVVSYFLERLMFPDLINALKVGGLLFYQTWLRERNSDRGPHNQNFRVEANELLRLCQGLHILFYREEGLTGDINQGLRDEAMLIGQRR